MSHTLTYLRPLLFLLYANDFQHCSRNLKFFLFADDTNVIYSHENLKTLELIVNAELNNLFNWLTSNKLTLHIKKKELVIFRSHKKKLNYLINIFKNEQNKNVIDWWKSYLERPYSYPYFGYGLFSWGNATETLLNKVLVLQKRGLRLIHFSQAREHAIPLFLKGELLLLKSLYYGKIVYLIFIINTNF